VEGLAEAFSKFKRLKVIHLKRDVIGECNPEEYVLELAEKCLQLKEVVVTDNRKYPRKVFLCSITRDGSVPRIFRLEEL
jgi:hypothetical protein